MQQSFGVTRVQTDGRFIEHVEHANQFVAELRRQTNALRFAARKGRRRPFESQVAQSCFAQEREAVAQFLQHVGSNQCRTLIEL